MSESSIKIGMTLSGSRLTQDNARFAAQIGATHIVVHPGRYAPPGNPSPYLNGGQVGPILGDCSQEQLWTYEDLAAIVSMLNETGLQVAAIENFAPSFWSDVLLDGPRKLEQMENLKRLVRDAGRAGVPVIGYNFSIAGVWGWTRQPIARGGAVTSVFDAGQFDANAPIPDGMVWNMRYRSAVMGAKPVTVSEEELWDRFAWFLRELVPVAEEAGVRLAAHPDDPPMERMRGTARLVNQPYKYERLLQIAPSPANALEFCLGSIQEMTQGNVYETTRQHARDGNIAYVHFRNVRGKVPSYEETFVDDGDIDMTEIIRILRDENFEGVIVPDHVPEPDCAAPWHAGMAYAVGYMRALTKNAYDLGPSKNADALRGAA